MKRRKKIKKESKIHRIATVISRVFDPFVTLGVVSVVAVLKSGLTGLPLLIFLFGIVFATILLLLTLLHWAVKRGHITNWDLTNRRERIIPLFITIGILIIDLLNARFFINDFLVNLFILYIFFIIGIFLITLFWKISGHSAGAMLASGVLFLWFGPVIWPVLLIVPVVGWARVIRKDHTVSQVVAGVVYSIIILSFFYSK